MAKWISVRSVGMRSGSTDGDGIVGTSAGRGRGEGRNMSAKVHWTDEELESAWTQITRPLATLNRSVTIASVDDGTGPRFMLEPGEVCPTCGEKTPSERALKMREWRAKRAAD